MAAIEITKADVQRTIETERDWWRAVFDLAAQNEPVTGNESLNGYWTYQELVGHINGWRSWTVARLEGAADGTGRPTPPWPAGMSDETEKGADEINAWFQQQSRAQSLDETIVETFALLDRMRDAVDRIPDERLLTPGAFAEDDRALANLPIGPALVGFSITHVHGEHALEIEPWLTERLGQHVELPPTPSNLGFAD